MAATPLERHDTVVRGDRGELRLEGGRITIHKDATTQAEPTEVTAKLSDLRGAAVSPAAGDQPAWLHVAVVGGSIAPTNVLTALSDPWTLPLTSRGVGTARRFVRMVERHVRVRGLPADDGQQMSSGVTVRSGPAPDDHPDEEPTPMTGPDDPTAATGPDDPTAAAMPDDPAAAADRATVLVDRLRELAELRDAGVLTDEEFRLAKAQVLGE